MVCGIFSIWISVCLVRSEVVRRCADESNEKTTRNTGGKQTVMLRGHFRSRGDLYFIVFLKFYGILFALFAYFLLHSIDFFLGKSIFIITEYSGLRIPSFR